MTDPVTNNFSLVQPTVGGDLNLWGGVLNNGVIAAIDATLGSNLSVAITTTDVTLTTAQLQNAIFVITGALTGNRSLILPLSPNSATVAVGGRFVVVNTTTGAYNLTVKTAASGSTGVTVPQGFATLLYSDGTNVGYADSGVPASIAAVNGNPNGQLAGIAGSINSNASLALDYTNLIIYVCTTSGNSAGAVWSKPVVPLTRGFDTAVNVSIVATHTGGNLLNIALKTVAGVDPSVSDSVICNFQTVSGAATTGGVTPVTISSALSMTTNATGATLGSVNSTPFRLWIALFNNAGTAVLAIRNCSTASGIFSIAEYGVSSTVAISGGATSAGVWYTPNGTTLSNCAFRVIGYCEYTSGLATAGTYTSDPSNTVIFGPGIKKPGDVVQSVLNSTATTTTINSSTKSATALVGTITPTSAANLVKVQAYAQWNSIVGSTVGWATLWRGTGTTQIGNTSTLAQVGQAGTSAAPVTLFALDSPGVTSSTQYGVYVANNAAGNQIFLGTNSSIPTNTGVMILEEIMG